MAMVDCRMMGIYPTTAEPMRSFVDAMMAAEDERACCRCRSATASPGATSRLRRADAGRHRRRRRGRAAARAEWARRFYDLRHTAGVRPLELDAALDRALEVRDRVAGPW
jgi:microcystin degradation protein MlrC